MNVVVVAIANMPQIILRNEVESVVVGYKFGYVPFTYIRLSWERTNSFLIFLSVTIYRHTPNKTKLQRVNKTTKKYFVGQQLALQLIALLTGLKRKIVSFEETI